MGEEVTITFKVKLETEEPAELIRLLESLEAGLLAGVADAVRERLTGEGQVVKVEMDVPKTDELQSTKLKKRYD